MVNNVNEKERKNNVLIGFTAGELKFLDRKIDKGIPELSSRSAIVRNLVCVAMGNPEILDFKPLHRKK